MWSHRIQSIFSFSTFSIFFKGSPFNIFEASCNLILPHSNKNKTTCQKINKLSFLYDTKKLISFFVHHHYFIFSFYITHRHHVDLLRSGPGNKETFNHLLLTCLIYTEAVTK